MDISTRNFHLQIPETIIHWMTFQLLSILYFSVSQYIVSTFI
jgi:hypothetical protein